LRTAAQRLAQIGSSGFQVGGRIEIQAATAK